MFSYHILQLILPSQLAYLNEAILRTPSARMQLYYPQDRHPYPGFPEAGAGVLPPVFLKLEACGTCKRGERAKKPDLNNHRERHDNRNQNIPL